MSDVANMTSHFNGLQWVNRIAGHWSSAIGDLAQKRQGIALWRSFCCSRSVLQGKVSPYHYEMLDVDSPFPGTPKFFGLLDSFRTLQGFDLLKHVLFRSDPPSRARGRASLGSRWSCRTGPDSEPVEF